MTVGGLSIHRRKLKRILATLRLQLSSQRVKMYEFHALCSSSSEPTAPRRYLCLATFFDISINKISHFPP
jgi:hypothetical protein